MFFGTIKRRPSDVFSIFSVFVGVLGEFGGLAGRAVPSSASSNVLRQSVNKCIVNGECLARV